MKSFSVSPALSGKKVVRVCTTHFPALKPSQIQKALRQKDVRINGKRIHSDAVVFEGDCIELWLPDNIFHVNDYASITLPALTYKTVFENDRLLIVNKAQGIAVHPGKGQHKNTLVDIIRAQTNNTQIQLCHRIDMNTGGIVILAKDPVSLNHMQKLFKENNIIKRYRCLVRGIPDSGTSCICRDDAIMKEMTAYLEKKSSQKVFVHSECTGSCLPIVTRYRILNSYSNLGPDNEAISELEVELVTGRTHQIRAHFSHINHPIIGDGKYGRNSYNKQITSSDGGRIRYQQLFATSIDFDRIAASNVHCQLSKRSFSIAPRYEINLNP